MELKTWIRAQWDRAVGALGVVAGLVALLLGYQGVADTPYPAEQIPYVVSGAVLGICLIGIGLTAWLSADLRDEWHKLDRIEQLLDQSTAVTDELLEDAGHRSEPPIETDSDRDNGHRSRPLSATSPP